MFNWLLILTILTAAEVAQGVPEAARYGQFSCVSCHVSPGGGGMLTNYGRMFSSEKMSTWSFEGEENLFYNLVRPQEKILAGGDARWIYQSLESGGKKLNRFWRMQTDLELVLHYGDFWFQGVMGTKPAGPMDNPRDHGHLVHRGYSLRYDLFEQHVLVRAGLFMPRHGLMIADHTAFTRMAMGFDAESEQTQVEATYQDDGAEMFVSSLIRDNSYDRAEKTKSGFNIGVAKMFDNAHRISAGLLRTFKKKAATEVITTGYGVSSVISLSGKIFTLLEFNRVTKQTSTNEVATKIESLASFATLNYEVVRGLSPFLRHELWDRDFRSNSAKLSRYGGGINWYPRPHLQTELRGLLAKAQSDSRPSMDVQWILHYYL